jgi:hypothetical protein
MRQPNPGSGAQVKQLVIGVRAGGLGPSLKLISPLAMIATGKQHVATDAFIDVPAAEGDHPGSAGSQPSAAGSSTASR